MGMSLKNLHGRDQAFGKHEVALCWFGVFKACFMPNSKKLHAKLNMVYAIYLLCETKK